MQQFSSSVCTIVETSFSVPGEDNKWKLLASGWKANYRSDSVFFSLHACRSKPLGQGKANAVNWRREG